MNDSRVAASLVALVARVAPAGAAEDRNQAGLSVAIVSDKDQSGTPTIDRGGRFHVVLTNGSDKPIRLWGEGNRYGHESLTFRVEAGNDPPSFMHKRPVPAGVEKRPPENDHHPARRVVLVGCNTFRLFFGAAGSGRTRRSRTPERRSR